MEQLLVKAVALFKEEFNKTPEVYAWAPGRVNIIGEHIDYNDGYVLPITIQLGTVVVGSRRDGSILRVITDSQFDVESNRCEITVNEKYEEGMDTSSTLPSWSRYLRGVLGMLHFTTSAFDALIVSNVPLGGGLSSSASFEISFCKFLEELNDQHIACGMQRALICQKGDHKYVHVPCGIMDQAICSLGLKEQALLIDCESNSFTHVHFDWPDCQLMICDSRVRHNHAAGEYSKRKSECDEAKILLGLKSWKDCTLDILLAKKSLLSDVHYRRAHHIVTEIKRTLEAANCNNPETLGRLMEESHYSLKNNYEVSCDQLDDIVESLKKFEGVYGSRMTGGGFGGYVVALVNKHKCEDVMKYIRTYTEGTQPIYIVEILNGCFSDKYY